VKDGRFVAGAGATEIELARKIHAQGEASPGLDQYAIKKFAESLEVCSHPTFSLPVATSSNIHFQQTSRWFPVLLPRTLDTTPLSSFPSSTLPTPPERRTMASTLRCLLSPFVPSWTSCRDAIHAHSR
jgi:hypothetical protein